ncbi:MAG: trypsin-like peptidase domain-containing protein [Myxococcales bacterium]|nr:trypsin-like peptidase domain-containing protein [Myxococcales bacterium]
MTPAQVVKVFATIQSPDYDCPWQMLPSMESSGSGVLIEGRRVLTGAHVIADATFVQVQKTTSPRKFIARVIAAAHDCDLALLEVKDPAFWRDAEVATLGDLPMLRDTVVVVGFPIGGEEVSYTQGVVSRIEVQNYTHSHQRLLAITVDAAINPGSSGGPAFDAEGRMVGIAFQKRSDADNIGHLVPAVLVRRFLAAVEQGRPLDLPSLGLRGQTLENDTLRRALGLGPDEEGVRVIAVGYGGSAWRRLRPDDVIVAIDGMAVANNGTVLYQGQVRTALSVALSACQVGDLLPVEILRGGHRQTVNLRLATAPVLVPRDQYDVLPRWLMYAGVVMQPLTYNYLGTWESLRDAPRELVTIYRRGLRSPKQREAIVIGQVLAHAVNVDYDCFADETVVAINGEAPSDLAHVAALLDQATGDVRIETSSGGLMAFDATEARAATERIRRRYRLPADRSETLVMAAD